MQQTYQISLSSKGNISCTVLTRSTDVTTQDNNGCV